MYYLSVEVRKNQGKRQARHAVESVERQIRSSREMNQGLSVERVGEATVHESHNGGHCRVNDALDRDIDHGRGFGLALDLCACPYPGHDGRGLGRHSTGLSAPDSYGIQP